MSMTETGADLLIAAIHENNFAAFMPDVDEWWEFVAERMELGADQIAIRILAEEDDGSPWYMWIYYEADRDAQTIKLQHIMLPRGPEERLNTPEGYEQVPTFYVELPEA